MRNGKHTQKCKYKKNSKLKVITLSIIILLITILTFTINIDKILAFFTDSDKAVNEMSISASYTVTFNSNTGTGTQMLDQEISYNVSTNLNSNTYVKDGYIFNGWNTQADGNGTHYADEASVSNLGNITLYAEWILDSFNITYNLNDGTIATSNPDTYTSNTETFTLNNPSKTGYTFKGWSGTDLTGDENQTVTIIKGSTGNREYTANWIPITYTIVFNANGGSGTMQNQPMTYDVPANLIKREYTKTGYKFIKWNTMANGNGTSYLNEQSVSNLTDVNNDTVTLYAIWELRPTKYAVQIYGINQDVDSEGNPLGLTFGPATGDNYNNAYVTHEYEEIEETPGNYYVKIVKHTVAEDDSETLSSEYLKNSSGANVTRTEAEKNLYNINIHNMTWTEISQVSNKEVFKDCMLCGDTKSVIVNLNSNLKTGNLYDQYGDGAGMLYNTINEYCRVWNPNKDSNSYVGTGVSFTNVEIDYGSNAENTGGYSVSHIRASLIGKNVKTNESYAGNVNLTESTCLYSCIESDLQDVITAKKINYVTGTSETSYSLNDDIADKIWLFSEREMYSTAQYSGNTTEGVGINGNGYNKFGNVESNYYLSSYSMDGNAKRKAFDEDGATPNWWFRSIKLDSKHNSFRMNSEGSVVGRRVHRGDGIAFGFCIR